MCQQLLQYEEGDIKQQKHSDLLLGHIFQKKVLVGKKFFTKEEINNNFKNILFGGILVQKHQLHISYHNETPRPFIFPHFEKCGRENTEETKVRCIHLQRHGKTTSEKAKVK